MRWITGAVALALATACPTAMAQTQTTKPDVSSAPSAQNSGAGIPGQPGNKSGPPAKDATVGSNSANQVNPTVQQQDTSNIKGMPGNKSGPPARQPSK